MSELDDAKNERRCYLIDKSIHAKLDENEEKELRDLQIEAEKHFDEIAPPPLGVTTQMLTPKQMEDAGFNIDYANGKAFKAMSSCFLAIDISSGMPTLHDLIEAIDAAATESRKESVQAANRV